MVYFQDPERLFFEIELEAQFKCAERKAMAEFQRSQLILEADVSVEELIDRALRGADLDTLSIDPEPCALRVSQSDNGCVVDATYRFIGCPQFWLFWPGAAPAPEIYGEVDLDEVRLFGLGDSEGAARSHLDENITLAMQLAEQQGRLIRLHRGWLRQTLVDIARQSSATTLH